MPDLLMFPMSFVLHRQNQDTIHIVFADICLSYLQDSHAQSWNSLGEFCPLPVLPPLIINLPRALSVFGLGATIKWDGWMDWSFARSSSIYNVDSAQLREAPFKLTQNLFGLYWHPPPRVDGT